jgi:trans-2,3-dihydro-3-hydroxyanthranilate isomerase
MFAPALGIAEDPATGSAVAAFAGVLDRYEPLAPGPHRFIIEQGFEMGRPSLISLELDVGTAGLETVRIGGQAVMTGEGWINV